MRINSQLSGLKYNCLIAHPVPNSRYEKEDYPWSEPLVVTQEERELVILPYVCLD